MAGSAQRGSSLKEISLRETLPLIPNLLPCGRRKYKLLLCGFSNTKFSTVPANDTFQSRTSRSEMGPEIWLSHLASALGGRSGGTGRGAARWRELG